MSFKENFLKKMEINRLAENVRQSLKSAENSPRFDKPSMQRLLDIAGYRYERRRDLDLYVRDTRPGALRILVLDNGLALYATSIADVVLRKSPTIKEMLSIRNAIKILSDGDVLVSKRADSVAAVQQECIGALDLSMNRSDLDTVAADGRIALEIEDRQGVCEALSIFRELLDYRPPPRHIAAGELEVAGALTTAANGELSYGPAFIYSPVDNTLKLIEEPIRSQGPQRSDQVLKVAAGKIMAAAEGAAVFKYLKNIAIARFF